MKQILKFLALAAIPGMAAASHCLPVVGTVKLVEDTDCTITQTGYLPDYTYVIELVPGGDKECFKTTLKLLGFGVSRGFSGVTREVLTSYFGSSAETPAFVPSGQQVWTARSWIPVNGTNGTVLYTAEIIIGSDSSFKRVTEQSVITGTNGQGLFKNVTGGFVITGNSIGQEVPIRGEFCFPES